MTPQRIQRQRVKGWRTPEGAVYVGRPTHFGNPFLIDTYGQGLWQVFESEIGPVLWNFHHRVNAHAVAVAIYRDWLMTATEKTARVNREQHHQILYSIKLGYLTGKDLICWCPPDVPCHADVLLEIANPRSHP